MMYRILGNKNQPVQKEIIAGGEFRNSKREINYELGQKLARNSSIEMYPDSLVTDRADRRNISDRDQQNKIVLVNRNKK